MDPSAEQPKRAWSALHERRKLPEKGIPEIHSEKERARFSRLQGNFLSRRIKQQSRMCGSVPG
jgi:hypothetical protein